MSNPTRRVEERLHTRGPWQARGCGGHSVVLSSTEPSRNDTRISAYGYRGSPLFSIGYPFLDDEGKARYDFVCFSHEDAHLIAAAPELLEACRRIIAAPHGVALGDLQYLTDAVAKSEGNGYACPNCTSRFVSVEARDRHLEKWHD